MQCRFTFKHMKFSQALADYAETKVLEKVRKYATKPIESHVVFSVEGRDHIAQCNITGGDGFNIQVQAHCQDMYGTVDLLVDRVDVQLRRQKEKLKDHKAQRNLQQIELKLVEPLDSPDDIPVDAEDMVKFDKAYQVKRATNL